MRKIKEEKESDRDTSLCQIIRAGLSDEVPSEQRHEGFERKSHVIRWRKRILRSRRSRCKGSEAGVCWVFSRNSKKASMTGGQCTSREL